MSDSSVSAVRKVGTLLQLTWRLAQDRRRQQLTYLGLMVIAQSISLTQPLLIGSLLNAVQENAGSLELLWPRLWPRLLGLFALELGFWLFHAPARVLERQLAFHLRLKLREELTRAVCELPMRWHKANHSGETID